ncbi:MAG: helix-turn-helix transcriptional regulator [Oribacterium sp.]|nr:helix-turn-helix transcriptional regulator [Oribacterium sp.]
MKKTAIDITTIGGRIKAKRIEAGLSQEKLAEMLMIKQNTLSNYENNSHDVPTDVLSEISKIFNTTPSYIIWGSCEEEDWTTEIRSLLRSIKNPKVRETAIKQLKALVEMDAALS